MTVELRQKMWSRFFVRAFVPWVFDSSIHVNIAAYTQFNPSSAIKQSTATANQMKIKYSLKNNNKNNNNIKKMKNAIMLHRTENVFKRWMDCCLSTKHNEQQKIKEKIKTYKKDEIERHKKKKKSEAHRRL